VIRQRLRLRRLRLAFLGRALLVLVALGLVWYGAMVVLLALKVSPDTVESLSGYRSAYDALAGLEPDDITGTVRLIAGLSGLIVLLVFGALAIAEFPRPYLARSPVRLTQDERGTVELAPRAIERVAEVAASEEGAVADTRARLADEEVTLELTVERARDIPDALRRAQERAGAGLARHGLPVSTVNVTLARFHPTTRKELR
jgi:hypothetical protein